ncbi:placenta-specific protein 1 [Aotus nancymaae]|uniref:placenta-specific protein 1 n=1 Tax=Aotus nancymaae TaxID=37293 RepID=UPI000625D626|nr:placenta-specific protein 1 [Aotus nancymaae]XP_012329728.1 placenta-specific protein 1 [Aotus nancymaae]XP_012329729.1 placenta-specific protein 1 [Aotus nancymaae]XP_021532158.1 placenta-specific protein 1 [Aotus nancymaae]
MKVFEFIGVMVLLTSAFSACSGQSPMTVLCSIDWFMVTVHPFMLNNDVCVHFNELHMGLGCPPNHVQPHAYQFIYRVTECGIRVKAVSPDTIIYSTEIHYSSKGTPSKFVIPVSCAAPKKSPWLTKPWGFMRVAGKSRATAQKDEKCSEVFTSSQPSQRPNCDCPPCVFNEEERTQVPCHQAEAQEAQPLQPSHFLDISEDWSLRADDLIGSM